MPTPKIFGFKEAQSQKVAIRNKAKGKAELVLYGPVGFNWDGEGITDKSVSDALKQLDDSVTEINVRLNSPGGDVFQGVAIYNRLKQHKAKVIVHIDGWAASIASIIMLAGDEIIMGEGTQVMVHLPWTFAMGDRTDLENTIDRLRDVEDLLINIYHRKTKIDKLTLRAMLEAETWMSAEEAIEKGFVDRETDEESLPIAASAASAPWLHAPKSYKTEKSAVKSGIKNVQKEIEKLLARK